MGEAKNWGVMLTWTANQAQIKLVNVRISLILGCRCIMSSFCVSFSSPVILWSLLQQLRSQPLSAFFFVFLCGVPNFPWCNVNCLASPVFYNMLKSTIFSPHQPVVAFLIYHTLVSVCVCVSGRVGGRVWLWWMHVCHTPPRHPRL